MTFSTGTTITPQSLTTEYTTKLRNVVSAAAVWYTGATSPGTYFPWNIIDVADRGGPSNADYPTDSLIIASSLASAFSLWAKRYTATRLLNWRKIYVNQYGVGDVLEVNSTAYASLLADSTQTAEIRFTNGITGAYMDNRYAIMQEPAGGVAIVWTTTGAAVAHGQPRTIYVWVAGGDQWDTLASKTANSLNADTNFNALFNSASYITAGNTGNTVAWYTAAINGTTTIQPNINAGNTGITCTTIAVSFSQPAGIDAMSTTNNIVAGQTATSTNLNNYLTDLLNNWNTVKANVTTYTTYYCHSNCHSSCHSSRSHR